MHMGVGVASFLSYDLIIEFMRHHDETNLRPMFIDHLLAMSLIGMGGGFIAMNSVRGAVQGLFFVGGFLGCLSYWLMTYGMRPFGSAHQGGQLLYYDADVSKEEKERIEMLDQLDILSYNMSRRPGYGAVKLNQAYQL